MLGWLAIRLFSLGSITAASASTPFFRIDVVDGETGRGIPLVELKTSHYISHYSDSNGIVAFFEPGLMDGSLVYFVVRSDGYEYTASLPGTDSEHQGALLNVTAGARATLKLHRTQLAERAYRMTGGGIY